MIDNKQELRSQLIAIIIDRRRYDRIQSDNRAELMGHGDCAGIGRTGIILPVTLILRLFGG